MDDTRTRSHIQEHADAVVRGDFDAVMADFSEELRPQVPQIAAEVLPKPAVTSADVLSVELAEEEAVAKIRYSGNSGSVTVRSLWRDVDDRPLIVHVEPVA